MLCDKCKQKEARIYYTEIVGGKKREQHLCEECAAELTNFQKEIPLESILSGLFSMNGVGESVCSKCGMSYQEFRHTGKFGCSNCYKAFARFLPSNLKRIQGADRHTGKVPLSWQVREAEHAKETEQAEKSEHTQGVSQAAQARQQPTIQQLREELQQAVNKEEYEEAARLRDLIRMRTQEKKDNIQKDGGQKNCQEKGGGEDVGRQTEMV